MIYTAVSKINITVPPSKLNHIDEYVNETLNKTVGKCSKTEGVVVKIINYTIHRDKLISNVNGFVVVKVEYEYQGFIPKIGGKYKGVVFNVFSEGLFCKSHHTKILIPYDFIKENGWVFKNESMVNSDSCIEIGDWIDVQIEMVQYVENSYHCVAKLIEE